METICAIEGLGLDYHSGQVLKYLSRYRFKAGIEDLKKARWYLERLIERVQNGCQAQGGPQRPAGASDPDGEQGSNESREPTP